MLTLYPSRSFVKNIGIDGTGTHGKGRRNINIKKFMRKKYVSIKNQKLLIKENIIMRKKFEKYFKHSSENIMIKIFKKYF